MKYFISIMIMIISMKADAQSISQTFKLAKKYFDSGKYEEAAVEYKKICEFYPNWDYPVFMLGNTYHNLGNTKEEFRCYHQAIKINPLASDNYIYLAQIHYGLGTLDSAEHYFKKGEELGDSEGEAAMGLANVFWDYGKFGRAITKANQAIHTAPKNGDLYCNRADIKFAMEDTLGALEDYNKAVKLSPKSAWVYTSRAAFYFDVENYAASKKDVEKALSINPKSMEAHYYKAGLLYLEGNEEEALKTFEVYYKDMMDEEMKYIPDLIY